MRPYVLPLAVLVSFAVPLASAQVYTWKDEQGRTVISDTPQTGKGPQKPVVPQTLGNSAPSAAEEAALADQELAFRKRQQEKKEAEAKAAEAKAAEEKKQKSCQDARNYLRALESGQRITHSNDKGEKEFLSDARRAEEVSAMQKRVQDACGNL
ncbi:MAG: DUF4124 domain-containing protein [Zoogloeaceae bacterium]|nr:DUF4124 domain-containing protein [Zoogloeaceae bacterium]